MSQLIVYRTLYGLSWINTFTYIRFLLNLHRHCNLSWTGSKWAGPLHQPVPWPIECRYVSFQSYIFFLNFRYPVRRSLQIAEFSSNELRWCFTEKSIWVDTAAQIGGGPFLNKAFGLAKVYLNKPLNLWNSFIVARQNREVRTANLRAVFRGKLNTAFQHIIPTAKHGSVQVLRIASTPGCLLFVKLILTPAFSQVKSYISSAATETTVQKNVCK